ncbi:SAM-dependent methyltransferase [Lactobacillus curvatus]|nr:SAM-dependent methyltransferase [Latilactobacillus curvatus]MSE23187.1 SAM-dependent methyltransferase [Latilactobacillus curvatus]
MIQLSYPEKLRQSHLFFAAVPAIHHQIQAVLVSLDLIEQGGLPTHNLPVLGIDESLYLEILLQAEQGAFAPVNVTEVQRQLRIIDHLLRNYREYLQNRFGMWAYITTDLTAAIAREFPNWHFLEVMAGNGYLSAGLRQAGADVICTDSLAWTAENETGRQLITPVKTLDANQALNRYGAHVDAILMSWSPNGVPVDYELLQQLRKMPKPPVLLCLGERFGATNSHAFWTAAHYHNDARLSRINRYLRPFDLMRDRFYWIQ